MSLAKRPAEVQDIVPDTSTKRSRSVARTVPYNQEEINLDLLKNGEWSDFTIKCKERTFKVHRFILSGKSPFFDRVFRGNFAEASQQQLDLSEEDPDAIFCVLQYLYSGEVEDDIQALEGEASLDHTVRCCLQLIKVYHLLDYLLLHNLQRPVFRKLSSRIRKIYFEEDQTPESPKLSKVGKAESDLVILEKILLAALEYEGVHDELIELMIWALLRADYDQSNCMKNDEGVPGILARHPELFKHMYLGLRELNQEKHRCFNSRCREPIYYSESIIVHEWVNDEWESGIITCDCQFRGFCSDECLFLDRHEVELKYGCSECIGDSKLAVKMDNPKLYLADGEITVEEPIDTI